MPFVDELVKGYKGTSQNVLSLTELLKNKEGLRVI